MGKLCYDYLVKLLLWTDTMDSIDAEAAYAIIRTIQPCHAQGYFALYTSIKAF
ncbi:hypothetical protein M5X00_20235 [Paenibacillus alvei]|uniref:Uncharacterized protein n=1 Tax=Paenibacillus alvei TaxID=44250 RepID=A0AAP6ZZN7_PAEAL|nr:MULTISPECIES: hypothetical protein [Paenibacillus]EJW16500.1 hypothetical protein PAV_5c00800 [Paenibacillus alvei DSM 29]MCY7484726.1 hypothetical protein [Paenibacillus alvei]MCY9542410.1 hypothetical protein [Paenibacillus alvei]MCY9581670.1 hypothetical protein [Paenibacillus alvei]MCY9586203.1 hypothetical protein [Paenibacillus alvei]